MQVGIQAVIFLCLYFLGGEIMNAVLSFIAGFIFCILFFRIVDCIICRGNRKAIRKINKQLRGLK
jgi:hypothetical protein